MLQLSLVGPPQPPEESNGRLALVRRIYATLSSQLCGTNATPEMIHACTEAVVDTLREHQRYTKP